MSFWEIAKIAGSTIAESFIDSAENSCKKIYTNKKIPEETRYKHKDMADQLGQIKEKVSDFKESALEEFYNDEK